MSVRWRRLRDDDKPSEKNERPGFTMVQNVSSLRTFSRYLSSSPVQALNHSIILQHEYHTIIISQISITFHWTLGSHLYLLTLLTFNTRSSSVLIQLMHLAILFQPVNFTSQPVEIIVLYLICQLLNLLQHSLSLLGITLNGNILVGMSSQSQCAPLLLSPLLFPPLS